MNIYNSLIKKSFTLDNIIVVTLFIILPFCNASAIVMAYTGFMLFIATIINFIFKKYIKLNEGKSDSILDKNNPLGKNLFTLDTVIVVTLFIILLFGNVGAIVTAYTAVMLFAAAIINIVFKVYKKR